MDPVLGKFDVFIIGVHTHNMLVFVCQPGNSYHGCPQSDNFSLQKKKLYSSFNFFFVKKKKVFCLRGVNEPFLIAAPNLDTLFFVYKKKNLNMKNIIVELPLAIRNSDKFVRCTFHAFSPHQRCYFFVVRCSMNLLLFPYQVMSTGEVAKVARKVRSALQLVATAVETHTHRISVQELFDICASTTASELGTLPCLCYSLCCYDLY